MDLRIDCRDVDGDSVIRVAGEMGAGNAAELVKLFRKCGGTVTVDLEQLVSADAAAVAVLRTLRDQGARLVGESHYIRMLIDREVRNRNQP